MERTACAAILTGPVRIYERRRKRIGSFILCNSYRHMGGGTKDSNDKTCACGLAGAGYAKSGRERCVCGSAGYGYDP